LFYTLIISSAILSGCSSAVGSIESMTAVNTDEKLPVIKGVKVMLDKTSVGFEWPAIKDKRVEGIDVYRGNINSAKLKKIATIGNRYTTHYVDTTIEPGKEYRYSFRTFGVLVGSVPGEVIRVKTSPPLEPVKLVKVYQPASGVVKLLWVPHSYPGVVDYVIQRRIMGKAWRFLYAPKGRLTPEYVDMSPAIGHQYEYRVFARTANNKLSLPSQAIGIAVR